MQAIDVLLSHGVHEEKILFLNLVRRFSSRTSIRPIGRWLTTKCPGRSLPQRD